MDKFTIDEKIIISVMTANVDVGFEANVQITLLDKNMCELAKKQDSAKVQEDKGRYGIVEYPFVVKDVANESGVDPDEVRYVKGWIDADNDREISRKYDEEVLLEIDDKVFVGFIHEPNNNIVHLLTTKDLKKYKIQSRNPVTKFLENQHPMLQGAGSIFAGLYGFGDWAARISGFRDWQLDNFDDNEQDMATDETKYIFKMIEHITLNKNGAGKIFLKSVKKYIKQNPEYVTSRFLTGTVLGFTVQPKVTTTKVPVGFIGITAPAIWGDITFSAKEIDQFARTIILGQ